MLRRRPWSLYSSRAAHRKLKGSDFDTPADIFPPRATKPDWAQKIEHWKKGPDGTPMAENRTLTSWVQQYHEGVFALDEAVGRLMETLEQTGQRKNTLVMFTSDQGLAFGQHGFRGTKVAAYDANVRSPLIFSMPGRIPENRVCKTPVSGVDLVPTMLKFAGVQPPWQMHGRDLTPLLKDQEAKWDHPAMLVATG